MMQTNNENSNWKLDLAFSKKRINAYQAITFVAICIVGLALYSNHVQEVNEHRLISQAVEYGAVMQDVDTMNELTATSQKFSVGERELKLTDAMQSCLQHASAYKKIASEAPNDSRHYQDIQFICETRSYTIFGSPVN
jgi:hypothetical protein